ncbi:MAG: UDP-N-acetylmuramoyl-L-alanine--D-glutamate ligase [Candidatus Babeliales bacterium]|nr:UDP-N-acetylmuramoyl-L-alanine--D-glutamate ligase [Candidatus Babeliales bacterium]
MNIPLDKKIGIWGLGVTGKSAVHYFHIRCYHIEVLDQKAFSADDQAYFAERNILLLGQEDLKDFLERNDYIFPSPGIDLAPYAQYAHKFLNELDLFYSSWKKPIIAITGSIGKTTITHLLSLLLQKVGLDVATGGNIGKPMLDLIPLQNSHDIALLELSSFQLEHCKKFAPDLAIITNLYPNHLDRHRSEDEYLRAKANIMRWQTDKQPALLPLALKDAVLRLMPLQKTKKHLYYFSVQTPAHPVDGKVYYVEQNIIHLLCDPTSLKLRRAGTDTETNKVIADLSQFPPITFQENWLIICAVFDIIKLQIPDLATIELHVPEHRLEKVATINGVDFYNDSKSTTTQSTLAAIERLSSRPILLILGGLSKGVDREPFVEQIKGKIKKIYCFGKEADQLTAMCQKYGIIHQSCPTLDDAVTGAIADMQSGDQIVLSPAGSSYDLYSNYIERGNHFKQLLMTYKKDIT